MMDSLEVFCAILQQSEVVNCKKIPNLKFQQKQMNKLMLLTNCKKFSFFRSKKKKKIGKTARKLRKHFGLKFSKPMKATLFIITT